MENPNDISIIEYIYQFNVSNLIKKNRHMKKELVAEVKKMIAIKEEETKKYVGKG